MNRRGFLGAILAAGVAPAAIGSGILMPVRLVESCGWASGIHFDGALTRVTGLVTTDREHIVYTEGASYCVEHAALDEYFRVSVGPGGMALTDFGPWGGVMVPRDLLGKAIPMRAA